jgi:flagellar basal-body rod protein FlgB
MTGVDTPRFATCGKLLPENGNALPHQPARTGNATRVVRRVETQLTFSDDNIPALCPMAQPLLPMHHELLFEAHMPLDLNSYLGIHQRALTLESQRTEVLAANLANADTPGYKARDIDFKAELAAAGSAAGAAGSSGTGSTPGAAGIHLATDNATLKYRVPLAPALDGNTVDSQLEQSAFAENSVRYQATLTLLNSKLRGLMTAITGQ